jgi:hypothetical protein
LQMRDEVAVVFHEEDRAVLVDQHFENMWLLLLLILRIERLK